MYAGADAKKALEAAARYDLYTNNVIQEAFLTEGPELPPEQPTNKPH